MEHSERTNHWQTIYQNKQINEVSWYQKTPTTSLDLMSRLNLDKHARIIDIGGGDSFFVDHLIDLGFSDITVLDISANAIERAKNRLGSNAEKVTWIVSDITDFKPTQEYDFWHDRAAFHFLKDENDIHSYIQATKVGVSENGFLTVGTFSKDGPLKCSGIEIQQYSAASLSERFEPHFDLVYSTYIDHNTPFKTVQNFVFCTFRNKKRRV